MAAARKKSRHGILREDKGSSMIFLPVSCLVQNSNLTLYLSRIVHSDLYRLLPFMAFGDCNSLGLSQK